MLHQKMGMVSTKVTASERLDQLAAPYKSLLLPLHLVDRREVDDLKRYSILSKSVFSSRIRGNRSFTFPMKVS